MSKKILYLPENWTFCLTKKKKNHKIYVLLTFIDLNKWKGINYDNKILHLLNYQFQKTYNTTKSTVLHGMRQQTSSFWPTLWFLILQKCLSGWQGSFFFFIWNPLYTSSILLLQVFSKWHHVVQTSSISLSSQFNHISRKKKSD